MADIINNIVAVLCFPLTGWERRWGKRGFTYNLIDSGNYTVVIGSDYVCDGPHRDFKVTFYHRRGEQGVAKWNFVLPTISFRTAYNYRKFGLLRVLNIQSRFLHRISRNPLI